jgi:release factor glutamine methyltransferase
MRAATLIDRAVRTLKRSPALAHALSGAERADAEALLRHVLGGDWRADDEIAPRPAARFSALVRRRARGEPVGHITGSVLYRGLSLRVEREVFVPRRSTYALVDEAVRFLRARRAPIVLDLGAGAGPLALAIAKEAPEARVYATDVSPDAVRLARLNARANGLAVRVVRGDLFTGLPRALRGRIDVIVAFLPSVPRGSFRDLVREIRCFDPRGSLTDESRDGLELLGRAAREGRAWLKRDGLMLFQVAGVLAPSLRARLRRDGIARVRTLRTGPPVYRLISIDPPPRRAGGATSITT